MMFIGAKRGSRQFVFTVIHLRSSLSFVSVQKVRSMFYAILSEYQKLTRLVVFELGWGSMGVGGLYAIPAMVEGQNELVSPWGRGLSNSSFMIMKSKAEIFVLQERS